MMKQKSGMKNVLMIMGAVFGMLSAVCFQQRSDLMLIEGHEEAMRDLYEEEKNRLEQKSEEPDEE